MPVVLEGSGALKRLGVSCPLGTLPALTTPGDSGRGLEGALPMSSRGARAPVITLQRLPRTGPPISSREVPSRPSHWCRPPLGRPARSPFEQFSLGASSVGVNVASVC